MLWHCYRTFRMVRKGVLLGQVRLEGRPLRGK